MQVVWGCQSTESPLRSIPIFFHSKFSLHQGRNNLQTLGPVSRYFLCVQTWCTPLTMLPMEQNVDTMLQVTAGQVRSPRARKAILADRTTVAWFGDKNLNLAKRKGRTKRFESDHSANNDPTNDCQPISEMLGVIRHSRRCISVKCMKNVGALKIKSVFRKGERRMFLERSIQASSEPCRWDKRLSTIGRHWLVIWNTTCVGYSRIS